jgi:hypothetical protein
MTVRAIVGGKEFEFINGQWVSLEAKRSIQAEAIGWTWAKACSTLDRGSDPRQDDVPSILFMGYRELNKPKG